MARVLDTLSRTPVLIGSLLAMLAIGAGFYPVGQAIGGELLDMVRTGDAAADRLAELDAGERRIHFWATVLLDSAYPLAYGAFFGGLAARFAGGYRALAVVPIGAAVAADFSENVVQAMALAGQDALLGWKDFLTPAKFSLVMVGAGLALVLALVAGGRLVLRRLSA
ncbi:MAG: hypothetical protein AAFX03_07030 [Pseudomonadota bacterium]